MAALQRVSSTTCATATNYAVCQSGGAEQFPAGLRVLVVDDDNACLAIVEHMLKRCNYHVTTSTQAKIALNLLREKKGCFDLVLSDVHMPDMNGYKLLEFVGLEMDLPVIMMSADGRTSAVMEGIKHGACDYLIKPIREEELKNIWQHVVRKKWHENKELDHSGSLDDNDRYKQGNDDAEFASSLNEGSEAILKSQKKRSLSKEEDDGEPESDDQTTSKKPRVVWSVELHEQFVNAVNHLGIEKAVPKRILELMNVPGLTRENVASHLQKFRLFLKKMSGVAHQGVISGAFSGPLDSNLKLHSLGRYDIQALAASGQIPPQTLAAMHAEFLGRPTGSLVATMDQPAHFQAGIQGSKYVPVEQSLPFGQPLSKCQSNVSKHFPHNMVSVEDASLGFGAWPSTNLGTIGPNANIGGTNTQNGNVLVDILQQHQQSQQPLLSEFNHSINVQPSCLVAPSLNSAGFQAGNSPASVNQNCNFNGSSIIDYSHIPSGDLKSTSVLSAYSAPGSLSPALPCSDNGLSRQVQNSAITFGATARQLSGFTPNICDVQGNYGPKSGEILDQGPFRNLGFVGKRASFPTRFAVDEYEATIPNFSFEKIQADNNGNKVKQEPNMEFVDSARVGIQVSQQFPPMMS